MPRSKKAKHCYFSIYRFTYTWHIQQETQFQVTRPGCVFFAFFTHLVKFNKTYTRCRTVLSIIDNPTVSSNELWTMGLLFCLPLFLFLVRGDNRVICSGFFNALYTFVEIASSIFYALTVDSYFRVYWTVNLTHVIRKMLKVSSFRFCLL